MVKLEDLGTAIGEGKEQGGQVKEMGEQKLKKAEDFNVVLNDGIDVLDEDTQEIKDTATEGAQEVAREQGENIQTSMESVEDNLNDISGEALGYADVEHGNAENISNASGDYDSVASQAESDFEQHAEQFEESGKTAQELSNEFKDIANDMNSKLDSLF